MPPVLSTLMWTDDKFILPMLKFFRELPQFFKRNGIEEIIIYGGFLRDYISGIQASDIDIRIVGNFSNFVQRHDGQYESVLKDYFITWLLENGFEVVRTQTNLVQFQKSDYGSSEPCISTKTSEMKSTIIAPQELDGFLKGPVKAVSEHFELVFTVTKGGIEYVLKFDISMYETPLEKNQTIADVDSLYLGITHSTELPKETEEAEEAENSLKNWFKENVETFSPSLKKEDIMKHLENRMMLLTSCFDDKSIPRITKMIRRGWKFSNSNQRKMVHPFLSSFLEGLKSLEDTMNLDERKNNILAYEEALMLIDEEEKTHDEEKTEHHSDDESNHSDDESYHYEDESNHSDDESYHYEEESNHSDDES